MYPVLFEYSLYVQLGIDNAVSIVEKETRLNFILQKLYATSAIKTFRLIKVLYNHSRN